MDATKIKNPLVQYIVIVSLVIISDMFIVFLLCKSGLNIFSSVAISLLIDSLAGFLLAVIYIVWDWCFSDRWKEYKLEQKRAKKIDVEKLKRELDELDYKNRLYKSELETYKNRFHDSNRWDDF